MKVVKVSGADMNSLMGDLQSIQEKMESSYQKVKQLKERIENQGDWEGKERDTFLTYFKLMAEYHRCFTDSCGKNRENPLKEAMDALKELETHVDSFYTEFPEYRNIEKI